MKGHVPTFTMQVQPGVWIIVFGSRQIKREYTVKSEADAAVKDLRAGRVTPEQLEAP